MFDRNSFRLYAQYAHPTFQKFGFCCFFVDETQTRLLYSQSRDQAEALMLPIVFQCKYVIERNVSACWKTSSENWGALKQQAHLLKG